MDYLTDLLPSPLQVIPGPLQQTCLYFARKKNPVGTTTKNLKTITYYGKIAAFENLCWAQPK